MSYIAGLARYAIDGTPVNGSSGTLAGFAPPGALLFSRTTGYTYMNVGTQAAPVWRVLEPAKPWPTGVFLSQPGSQTTAAPTANVLMAIRRWIPHAMRINALAVHVTTQQSGSNVRAGIYTDSDGVPSSRLVEANIDTTSTGLRTATVDILLQPGYYWFAAVGQGTTPATVSHVAGEIEDCPVAFSGPNTIATQSGVSGSLPSTFSRNGDAGTCINVLFRIGAYV